MTRAFMVALALVCSLAACEEESTSAAIHNECGDDDDCVAPARMRDRNLSCDENLAACVRRITSDPYQLIVRVTATAQGTTLADAGIALSPVAINNLGTLDGQRDAQVLVVPAAVNVRGAISVPGSAELVPSQLMFAVRDAMVPIAPTVLETQAMPAGDGGVVQLSTLLNPDLAYDLRVQPVTARSSTLPPIDRALVTLSKPLQVDYTEVQPQKGKFIYRDAAPPAFQVRLQDKQSGRVVSSTVRVVPDNSSGRYEGAFTLFAEPAVFAGKNFNLVVGLTNLDPWQVTMTIDGARFLAGGDMFLPKVPKLIRTSSRVEIDAAHRLANADLLFVSHYSGPSTPPPDAIPPTMLPDPPDSSGGTDWCRSEDVVCSGRFQTTSDEFGNYEIDLLPGDYDAYIVPRTDEPSAERVLVTQTTTPSNLFSITEETGGGNLILTAKKRASASYTGRIWAGSLASAGVTLNAWARPTPALSSWGSVANLNRNHSTVSDRNGRFALTPDVGYYDFVLETDPATRFAWKLWLDCPNGPDAGAVSLGRLDLSAPVLVAGVVEAAVEGEAVPTRLPKARIEAFAIVEHKKGGSRSVLIGRTTSGENGEYLLLLPQQVGERDRTTCESTAPEIKDNARATR